MENLGFINLIISAVTLVVVLPIGLVGLGLILNNKKIKNAIENKLELEKKINELINQKTEKLEAANAETDLVAKTKLTMEALKIDDKIADLQAEKK